MFQCYGGTELINNLYDGRLLAIMKHTYLSYLNLTKSEQNLSLGQKVIPEYYT